MHDRTLHQALARDLHQSERSRVQAQHFSKRRAGIVMRGRVVKVDAVDLGWCGALLCKSGAIEESSPIRQ